MKPKSEGSINSAQVAKLIGVSRSTVSKVLNGYPNISGETRAKVLKAIKDHSYYPKLSGQLLTGKRSETIGLFFLTSSNFSNDVLVNYMLARVIESAATYGYHILTYILQSETDPRTLSTIKGVFHQGRIDGGVFIGAKNRAHIIEELVTEGFPVGVFDQEPTNSVENGRRIVVSSNDARIAHEAIDYLTGLGHRKIAVTIGDIERYAGVQKRDGFLSGLADNGITIPPEWLIPCDFNTEAGWLSIRKFLQETKELPTAIAAINDHVAFGALRAISEAGLRVPDDISLIGMDGHPLGEYSHPPLTTFRIDFEAMMLSLVSGVINLVESRETATDFVFDGKLMERDSCRRLA